MSWFLVLTGLVGLGLGVWLGMPGRYTQSADDIEKIMDSGDARRRKARRVFTPLAWMQRRANPSTPSRDRLRSRGSRRSGFQLESPDDL